MVTPPWKAAAKNSKDDKAGFGLIHSMFVQKPTFLLPGSAVSDIQNIYSTRSGTGATIEMHVDTMPGKKFYTSVTTYEQVGPLGRPKELQGTDLRFWFLPIDTKDRADAGRLRCSCS